MIRPVAALLLILSAVLVAPTPATAASAPSTITAFKLTPGPGHATPSWATPSANGAAITSYAVAHQRRSASGAWSAWSYLTVPASYHALVVYRPAGGVMRFKVRARNSAGAGPWSAELLTTVPAQPTGTPTYRYPVSGCSSSYPSTHHDYPAADIFAARGCSVVAPTAGTVDEVSRVDRWSSSTNVGADRGGLFVSIVGYDGVRYYGSHLASVASGIKPGVTVKPGTPLGTVGTTGSAAGTPPHLHFGLSWPTRPTIWWVRRGKVAPQYFLDGWRAGENRSPRQAVLRAREAAGTDVPPCGSYC